MQSALRQAKSSMTPIAQAINRSFNLLSKLVIPLYVDDARGRPQPCGSGFFVRAANVTLLVSAAHVLEQGKTAHLYYYIAPKLRRLVNGEMTSNKWVGSRDKDLLDVAAVRLEGGNLPPYPEVEKLAINLTLHPFAEELSPTANYGLIGFPASRSRIRHGPKEIRASAYGHLAESAPLREYAARGLRPDSHLYLVFNRKKSFDLEGHGRAFPNPHGLSGAPVFQIFDQGQQHQGQTFPLAGMVTTWWPQEHRILCASATSLRELINVAT